MKAALVLIDMQKDYLAAPGLEPAAGCIVAGAVALLKQFREQGHPVIHVRTTVTRDPDNRMPHWKEQGKWICVAGTPGYAFADELEPKDGERIIDKQFFSGFAGGTLEDTLRAAGCDTVVLAGVHLHACIRSTALGAYARGFEVHIAERAVGTDDPVHGAITRRYLTDRNIRFMGEYLQGTVLTAGTAPPDSEVEPEGSRASQKAPRLIHMPPAGRGKTYWFIDEDGANTVTAKARQSQQQWLARKATAASDRSAFLRHLAEKLGQQEKEFAEHICNDVGKPITMARGEVRRSVALLRAAADFDREPLSKTTGGTTCRHMPLGVIATITPWNNPLAIPIGKIAPAVFYDNAVLWKPAPAASMIAWRFYDLWREAGGTGLDIVSGGESTARHVVDNPFVAGVTLSGSAMAGLALQELAAKRRVPFQGELGGNNAAIIWGEADIADAARQVAAGAFGFAGQRCTANRRVIVPARTFDGCPAALVSATRELAWGDPWEQSTQVGPVISVHKFRELNRLRKRAERDGLPVIEPHASQENRAELVAQECYFPPIIVVCDDPSHEIVQEESFGPILVVQRAESFDHAMQLCNGVRQGLAAALFSNDKLIQERFLREAQAGILKINQATADADAVSPFGGWKASGVGPAEHGVADREFFTRMQTVYGI